MRFVAYCMLLVVTSMLLACSYVDRFPADEANAKSLRTALEAYKVDIGRYPSESEGLRALTSNPGLSQWRGPYLDNSFPLGDFSYRCDRCTRPDLTVVRKGGLPKAAPR
jgi:hypothetical protein